MQLFKNDSLSQMEEIKMKKVFNYDISYIYE